jgi:phenylpyruvate tautomerase PptA (4-oxalocrotonate tautomerase family)
MPYVEILAPPAPPQSKAALAKSITDGLMSSFGVGAETITLFFVPIMPGDYAHAGEMGSQGTGQRILLKVHAFRRSEAERTRSVCNAYGVPGADVAAYFFDREKDEVAHDSKLASD